jgi:lipopolysaccharide cholinephosphotransferase
MLDEFAHVCEQASVEFFLDAGTLLGAYRYGDWIPWDDDVDVLMTRREYQRFREIAPGLLPDWMRLSDPQRDADHVTFVPRILYGGSRLVWVDAFGILPPERQVINLDIFILDSAPRQQWGRRPWLAATRLLQALSVMRSATVAGVVRSTPARPKRMAGLLLVAGSRLLPAGVTKRLYFRVATAFEDSGSEDLFVLNHSAAQRAKPIKKAWISGKHQLPFAGRSYRVPDPVPYLTCHFGSDFRQEPPVSQRVSHRYEEFEAQLGDKQWRL